MYNNRWVVPGNICSTPVNKYDFKIGFVFRLSAPNIICSQKLNTMFSGMFAKLRKVTISFIASVRMEELSSHWTDFREILYLTIFRKCFEKIEVSLKSDKNKWYFTRRPIYIFYYILTSS
jgi:hypothetical protein